MDIPVCHLETWKSRCQNCFYDPATAGYPEGLLCPPQIKVCRWHTIDGVSSSTPSKRPLENLLQVSKLRLRWMCWDSQREITKVVLPLFSFSLKKVNILENRSTWIASDTKLMYSKWRPESGVKKPEKLQLVTKLDSMASHFIISPGRQDPRVKQGPLSLLLS